MISKDSSLVRVFSRYCDLEKAARYYKLSFAIAVAAWAIRTGLVGVAAIELIRTMADIGFFESFRAMAKEPDFALKATLYGGIWGILKITQWAGAIYGAVGLAYKGVPDKKTTEQPPLP